jgi:glycyl-tRNA synthetase
MPLSKKESLIEPARRVQALLRARYRVEYDQTGGNIGRRYRRQDEIGTPYCVTIDFDTLDDQAVTIRERDSMEQERIPIEGLVARVGERLG